MVSGAGAFPFYRYIPYQVYRDSGRTQVWGQSAGQAVSGLVPPTGVVRVAVYIRVPAAIVIPTAYRDVLTISVDY